MKRIYLCRHAKSSWKDMSCADVDRRLNKRGKRNALLMGKRLFNAGVRPDCIISSPAVRAWKTARCLAKELAYPKEIVVNEEMYAASVGSIMACIRGIDDHLDQVVLVGHNPEITLSANILAKLDIYNVPTCGVVAVEFKITRWQEIREGNGELVFFDYPKKNRSENN